LGVRDASIFALADDNGSMAPVKTNTETMNMLFINSLNLVCEKQWRGFALFIAAPHSFVGKPVKQVR